LPQSSTFRICQYFIRVWLCLVLSGVAGAQIVSNSPSTEIFSLFRFAALFPASQRAWTVYYIQGRVAGGNSWFEIPESMFFRLRPIGYRTRLQRIFESPPAGGAARTREALAHWVKERFEDANHGGKLESVRFVARVFSNESVRRGIRYAQPPMTSTAYDREVILSTHHFR
jgi:hypothetical protein